jgi:hypothetical protein
VNFGVFRTKSQSSSDAGRLKQLFRSALYISFIYLQGKRGRLFSKVLYLTFIYYAVLKLERLGFSSSFFYFSLLSSY